MLKHLPTYVENMNELTFVRFLDLTIATSRLLALIQTHRATNILTYYIGLIHIRDRLLMLWFDLIQCQNRLALI